VLLLSKSLKIFVGKKNLIDFAFRHRESESRVLVKLVDRGDEILVDTSELLQLEKKYFTIPAFAQPFRLYNYDESVGLFIIKK